VTNLVSAAQGDTALDSSIQGWTIEQLCEARDTPEAWTERRDLFSSRELQSIDRQRVRSRISEEALFCFMGEPDEIVDLAALPDTETVDAYCESEANFGRWA
jgi:hypothetical protein